MDEVWSRDRYEAMSAIDYLQSGEKLVNDVEEIIAAAASRSYDELVLPPPPERDLREFLNTQQPCAAVVFDGLSLREIPLIHQLAKESKLNVVESGWSTAATPSETVYFVEQRLRVSRIAPSQLPGNRELSRNGIACHYLEQVNQQRQLSPNAASILLWSSFPDYRYKERDARFAEMFENLHAMMTTAWQNSVQAITRQAPRRRILITSDHGYIFFGAGCSANCDNDFIRPLTEYLGGDRCAELSKHPSPPDHRGLAVFPDRDVAMIRGRIQTHPRGEPARKIYKHGGLSLMEMLTPWVLLEETAS